MATTSKGLRYPLSSDHTRLWEHFQNLATDVNSLPLSGERIATTIATANSGTITTTETVVMTVVAPVVVGRIYKITADFGYDLSVAGDAFNATFREDSVSGTVVKLVRISTENLNGVIAAHFEGEYTADTTEDKTLVLTFDAASASGNIVLSASATSPSYLYVDYIRG